MENLLLPAAMLLIAATLTGKDADTARADANLQDHFTQRIDQEFAVADANEDGFANRSELEAAQQQSFAGRKRRRCVKYKEFRRSRRPTKMAR